MLYRPLHSNRKIPQHPSFFGKWPGETRCTTLKQLPRNAASALPYRAVDVLAIAPTQSLDALAQQHIKELPSATRHALSGLGVLKDGGGVLASYLLFEPGFVKTLIAMGESDAYARKAEFLEFFSAG